MADVAKSNIPIYRSPIADPMIEPEGKLHSKILKLLKKAHGTKAVKRGVPEITKLLRKEKKGIVIFAGDIFPVELMCHMPILCEDKNVFYAYVHSRSELGLAINSKRPVSVVFIPKPPSDSPYESAFEAVEAGLKEIHPYMGAGKKETVATAKEGEEKLVEKKEKKEKKKKNKTE